jgi:hypothetical protein
MHVKAVGILNIIQLPGVNDMAKDFLNDPEFNIEGLGEIKGVIDHFFIFNQEAVKKPITDKPKAEKPVAKGKKTKIKLPEAPEQTAQEVLDSIELTKGDIEYIREEFYEFQSAISNLPIYPYIYEDIERFVESCIEMSDMIEDNIDKDKLSTTGRLDYEEMQKVRARILSSIYNYYKKEE